MADDGDRHDIKAASTQRRERDGHAAKQLSDHLVLDPGHPRDRTMNLQVREAPSQSVSQLFPGPSPREAPTAVRNTSFVRSFLGPHGQTHTQSRSRSDHRTPTNVNENLQVTDNQKLPRLTNHVHVHKRSPRTRWLLNFHTLRSVAWTPPDHVHVSLTCWRAQHGAEQKGRGGA